MHDVEAHPVSLDRLAPSNTIPVTKGNPMRFRCGRRFLSTNLQSTRLQFEQLEDRTVPSGIPRAVPYAIYERVNVVMTSVAESDADKAALAAAPFAANVDYLGFGIYSVALNSGTTAAQAVDYYSARPRVVGAVADSRIEVQNTPNDTSYSSLWGMARIHAPTAWDSTTGSSSFVVAVLDTGVDYNHPDLAANIWTNSGEIAGNGIDDDGNGYIDDIRGWDFANGDNNPMDDNNHGTHAAGTVGAVGNNALGVVGVNWSVKIMPLKIIDSTGSGWTSDAVQGLDYAVNKGVKVSSNSWGGGPANFALANALDRARTAGHIFVAAAGNSGLDLDTGPEYPASYSTSYNNVVTVASINSSDQLASNSNYGVNSVTLAAPGVSILSTIPGGGYGLYSGTSMATPHVAGAIALYWASHPTETYTQVINKLKSSVDPVAGLATKVQTGGVLNVGAMFVGQSPPPPAVAPGPVVTGATYNGTPNVNLNRVRFTFDRAVDPATFTAADVASFTGPNGTITTTYTVAAVAGTGNTQFDVSFGTQTASGNYTMVIGPNIRDMSGNPMNQDGDGTNGEATQDQYTAAGTWFVSGPRVTGSTYSGSANFSINKVRLTFDRAIDPATFTSADVASFTGPSGAITTTYTVAAVSGSGNTQFDVSFGAQTATGTYTLVVGPDVRDASGNPMNQDGDGTNGETTQDQYAAATTLTGAGARVTGATYDGTPNVSVSRVRFTFDHAIDPTTFTAADVASFTGPNGAIATSFTITPVSGTGNTQFDVNFGAQTASGSYTMVIGPDVRDVLGNPMNQDGDGTNGEATQDQYTAAGTWFVSGPRVTGSTYSGSANFSIDRVRLTFDRAVDPATFTAADVASFTGPSGAITTTYTIAAVSGSGNTQFDVSFGAQTATGTYTLVVGPDVRDTSGNPMNQDGDGTNGETTQDRYSAATTLTGSGARVTGSVYSGTVANTFDKVRLTFDKAIDPATFTSADIASFTGPSGAIASSYSIAAVAGSGSTQFDVSFAAQSVAGTYTLVVGPDIRDVLGNPMNQDGDGTNGEATQDQYAANGTLTVPPPPPPPPPPAVAPGPVVTGATYNGTPNVNLNRVRFTFDRAVDPATFTAADVASFTGPNGTITTTYTVAAVAGTGNTQFDVSFGTQTASGNYTMVIGPNIRDMSGNPMNQDGDGTNGEATQDQYTAAGTWFVSGPRVTGSTYSGSANFSINKVRLTFDRAIDPATFTSADVASFTGPSGAITTTYTVAAVSGSGNTQFDVSFGAQTATGTYTLVVGPDVRDASGNPMNQDGDGTNGETTQDQYAAATTLTGAGAKVTGSVYSGTAANTFDKVRLTFDKAIDPATFTSADVASFAGPSGAITATYTITAVAGSGSTQFDVSFAAQSVAGTYTLVVGPDIRDVLGNPMNQDGDGTNGEATQDQYAANGTLTVPPPPPPPPPTSGPAVINAEFTGVPNVNVSRVRFTFNKPIDPATFTTADIVNFIDPNSSVITTTYTIAVVTGSGNTQFDVSFGRKRWSGRTRW